MPFGQWQWIGSVAVADIDTLAGLTDVAVVFDGTTLDLIATSRGGGWVHRFTGNNQAGDTVAVSSLALPSHLLQLEDPNIAIVDLGGEKTVLLGGLKTDWIQGFEAISGGAINLSDMTLSGLSGAEVCDMVEMGQQAGLLVATQSGAVVQVDLVTQQTTTLTVQGALTQAAATSLAYLDVAGQHFGVAAYGQENILALFSGGAGGALSLSDTIQAGTEGLWINTPTALDMVEIGGQAFVLAAAAGSSSITVLAIDLVTSEMQVVDHVMDTRTTRFSDITHLETVKYGGRSYIVAAGADGGLSLLSLLPDGTLMHMQSFEATHDATLQSITGLTTSVTGTWLRAWVTTQEAPYLVEFAVDLSGQGTLQTASVGGNLVGTSRADILLGSDANDHITGHAGDDILRDGAGQDTLTGGNGADVFAFVSDGTRDRITDFDPTQDRLDLGQLDSQFDLHAIEMSGRSWGVEVRIGDEVIEVYGAGSNSLTPDDLISALFVPDLERVATVLEPDPNAGNFLMGSGADDLLIGTGIQDTLQGYEGADRISGREDHDLIDGGSGADILVGGGGDDEIHGGQGGDVLYGDIPDDLAWI